MADEERLRGLALLFVAAALAGGCHQDVVLIGDDAGTPPLVDCMTCTAEGDCQPVDDGTLCSVGVCVAGECATTGCEAASGWVSVAAGDGHTCAVGWQGDLWCWGDNKQGQLGAGDVDPRDQPVSLTYSDWAAVSAGAGFSCAVSGSGDGSCWGQAADGQTGSGAAMAHQPLPEPLAAGGPWRTVDGGQNHACGVTDDGGLWCWGKNDAGQLGVGGAGSPTPVQVDSPDRTWRVVSAGNQFTCAVDWTSRLGCWGANGEGQLGTGDTKPHTSPTDVAPDTMWSQVSAGVAHTCAIDVAGGLWCWGKNRDGEVGAGDDPATADRATAPVAVAPEQRWAQVACGDAFTCAIGEDRGLWCWGKNDAGQLGLGDTMVRRSPVRVGTALDWVQLTAGRRHACGIRAGGGLFCWGDNSQGQIDLGDLTASDPPVETCPGDPVD